MATAWPNARRAVDMIEADALILHLNALQEAVQPEGDGNFAGLLSKIEHVCRELPVPVIAKEVGWGFSEQTARQLADAGVAAIDVAGAGGTSWSQVEMYRAPTARHARVAGAFIDWGIPTAVSIRYCKQAAPGPAHFRQRRPEQRHRSRQMHRPWRFLGRAGRQFPARR